MLVGTSNPPHWRRMVPSPICQSRSEQRKAVPRLTVSRAAGTDSFPSGEVAEWLKAAVC
jgi:hypothetical protein